MATISEVFSQIANSIRNKLGTTIGYKPEQMPAAIDSIPQEVIGDDTSDATATAADIASGKTAYAKSVKLTGTNTKDSNTQDATATASDILSGKTAYAKGSKITGTSSAVVPSGNINLGTFTENGSKTNLDVSGKATASFTVDVPSSGTDTSDATVTSNSQILSGYSAYSNGTKFTGSMPNNGAVSQTLNPGGSYTIPSGFHNGNGSVSARSLNLQTKSEVVTPSANWSGTYTNSVDIDVSTGYDGMSKVSVSTPMLRDNTLMSATAVDTPSTVYNGNTAQSNSEKMLKIAPTKDGMSYTNSYLYLPKNSYLGNATAEDVVSGKTFSSANGIQITGTGSSGTDTSDATASASNIDSGYTAYVNGSKITGTSTKTDTSDATVTSSSQILSGYSAYSKGTKYSGGIISRSASSESISSAKTYYSGYYSSNWTVTPTGIDTSDATAIASNILVGKTAYVKGVKITGTLGSSFSDATDEEITAALAAHRLGLIDLTKYWSVGDERPVHLSAMAATGVGESHVAQDQTLVILHGSNCFDLSDGGKNIFVIGLKGVLANGSSAELGYVNSTNTNSGGWKESLRRPWCDNVFMPSLPAEVQKWFKKFKYKASDGNKTTSSTIENYFTFASVSNVFGASYNTNYAPASEDESQFDYYKTESNRVKHPGNYTSGKTTWRFRSAHSSNTTSFAQFASSTSDVSGAGASNTRAISPFGCV